MTSVFGDTFYFVARLHQRDQYHDQAVAYSHTLRGLVVTTDWVLMEVADALCASENRTRVAAFLRQIHQLPGFKVVPASRTLLVTALDMYQRHSDKAWTLTDCTSFVVMREMGITQVLTGDHHFEQAGFAALLK